MKTPCPSCTAPIWALTACTFAPAPRIALPSTSKPHRWQWGVSARRSARRVTRAGTRRARSRHGPHAGSQHDRILRRGRGHDQRVRCELSWPSFLAAVPTEFRLVSRWHVVILVQSFKHAHCFSSDSRDSRDSRAVVWRVGGQLRMFAAKCGARGANNPAGRIGTPQRRCQRGAVRDDQHLHDRYDIAGRRRRAADLADRGASRHNSLGAPNTHDEGAGQPCSAASRAYPRVGAIH